MKRRGLFGAAMAALASVVLPARAARLFGDQTAGFKSVGDIRPSYFRNVTVDGIPPDAVNVRDFRVAVDGENWVPAFQRAIAAAAGGVVLVPAGNYLLGDRRVRATGPGGILKNVKVSGAKDGPVFSVDKPHARIENWHFDAGPFDPNFVTGPDIPPSAITWKTPHGIGWLRAA